MERRTILDLWQVTGAEIAAIIEAHPSLRGALRGIGWVWYRAHPCLLYGHWVMEQRYWAVFVHPGEAKVGESLAIRAPCAYG